MRFTLLCASTALAASLLLSACSGGAGSTGASAIPSGGGASSMGHHKVKLTAIAMHVDRGSPCPSSQFIACFALNYGSGPYTEWSACFSTYDCPPTYDIVASAVFSKKHGGNVGRGQIAGSDYYPSPGNPTYQYITPGRHYAAHAKYRFIDATSAYLYYYPSSTGSGSFGIY